MTDYLERLMKDLPPRKIARGVCVFKPTLRRVSETVWSASYESGNEVYREARAGSPVDAVKELMKLIKA